MGFSFCVLATRCVLAADRPAVSTAEVAQALVRTEPRKIY